MARLVECPCSHAPKRIRLTALSHDYQLCGAAFKRNLILDAVQMRVNSKLLVFVLTFMNTAGERALHIEAEMPCHDGGSVLVGSVSTVPGVRFHKLPCGMLGNKRGIKYAQHTLDHLQQLLDAAHSNHRMDDLLLTHMATINGDTQFTVQLTIGTVTLELAFVCDFALQQEPSQALVCGELAVMWNSKVLADAGRVNCMS